MASSWFPVAIIATVASSFALWYSMEEWERSRYFGLIVGVPVTVFAFLGVFGIARNSLAKTPTYVKTSG